MLMAKSRTKRRTAFRSELNGRLKQEVWQRQPIREAERWLLRSGLSPAANRPMSEIGIYTDFT